MMIIKSYEFRIWVCFGHYNGGNTMTAAYTATLAPPFFNFSSILPSASAGIHELTRFALLLGPKNLSAPSKRFTSCSAHISPLLVFNASKNLDVSDFFGDGKWLTTVQGHSLKEKGQLLFLNITYS